jgi:uncharacterized protein (DUF3084 family)
VILAKEAHSIPVMLNELDALSQNIGRLIALSASHDQRRREAEHLLEAARTEREAVDAELEQTRRERDALRDERDALSAKIDDAQVRLNAILEKLPHQKGAENQLDLLASATSENLGDQA